MLTFRRSVNNLITGLAIVLVFVAVFLLASTVSIFAGEGDWTAFQNGGDNNGITTTRIATTPQEAAQRWSVSVGTGKEAVTPAIFVQGHIYVASDRYVYKIDRDTGAVLKKSSPMEGSVEYGLFPPTYAEAEGKIYIGIDNGRIQALDFGTLEPSWCTTAKGGQAISPVIYKRIGDRGMVLTGTFNGKKGVYFAVDAKTGEQEWVFDPERDDGDDPKGRDFYWVGAYVNDNRVYVGSDAPDRDSPSTLFVLDVKNGNIVDRIDGVSGNIRSTVVHNEGKIYFVSQGGELYQAELKADGSFGEGDERRINKVDLGGPATTTPVINGNRLYVGVGAKGLNDDNYVIVDTESMSDPESATAMTKVPVSGYPQGSPVAYAKGNDSFVAYTYNHPTSGLYIIRDELKDGSYRQSYVTLHQPEYMEYCISHLCVDDEGTIYYVNDSFRLMAVERKVAFLKSASFRQFDESGRDVGSARWKGGSFKQNVRRYNIILNENAKSVSLEDLAIPSGAEKTVVAGGVDVTDKGRIELGPDGTLTLDVTVSKDEQHRTYIFDFKKDSDEAGIESLIATRSRDYRNKGQNLLTQEYREGTGAYRTVEQGSWDDPHYVWVTPLAAKAKVNFIAVSNVKDYRTGEIISECANEKDGSWSLYIDPADKRKSVRIRIEITSPNGVNRTTNTIDIIPRDMDSITPSDKTADSAKENKNLGIKSSGITVAGDLKKKNIKLTWKKTGGANNYRVSYREAGKTWKSVWTKGANTYTITNLKKKGLYEFRIQAFRKSGNAWSRSGWTNAEPKYFETGKVKKILVGKKRMTVKISKVKNSGGYRIIYTDNKSMKKSKTKVVNKAGKVKIGIGGLKKGKVYYVKVAPIKKYKGKTYIGLLSKSSKSKKIK